MDGASSTSVDAGAAAVDKSAEATTSPDIEKVLDLLMDKKLYPLSLEDAEKKLEPIAELHRESPSPDDLLMVGAGSGCRRIEISYIKNENNKWEFSGLAAIFTTGSAQEVPVLFRRIEGHVRKKLGKPLFTRRTGTLLPKIGWRMKRPVELWLTENTNTLPDGSSPERHVQIAIGTPGGEPD
jgi:hypothetical protein